MGVLTRLIPLLGRGGVRGGLVNILADLQQSIRRLIEPPLTPPLPRRGIKRKSSIVGLFVLLVLTRSMASQQRPDARIEGWAVRFGTGEPLSNAKLELRGGSETLSTTTEIDGKFYFPNLQP